MPELGKIMSKKFQLSKDVKGWKNQKNLCGQLVCNEEYLKFRGEGPITIDMQDILEEISDTN